MTVVDTRGNQTAEVSVLGPDGRDDAAALDTKADAPATVIRAALADRNGSLLAHELGSRGLDPAEALAVRLFGDWSPAGSAQTFRAERAVTVVVAAPAGRIVDGAPPPSELLVEVRRATPRSYEQQELPPPLAEPRLDFRVDAATALAYEVRAGEFIQVIDVEGKQCSDFLAFHRRKLESGLERGLDATTTRSLMGQAYPQPGLQGKFYDVDQDPLIEVVRDTVGRHDTFGLACTAKYYEDKGYPGHVNCTRELQRAGDAVRHRAAHGLGGAQLLLQHGLRRLERLRHGRAMVAPRRLRAPARDERSRVRIVGVPRRHRPGERLADHSRPRARLCARQHLLRRDREACDRRCGSGAHEGDDVPSADERADEELRRVPRLLAPALLRQRGRDRRVLGLPREGRDHGSLAAAQVGDPRPRRRSARPARDHARRAPSLGRPGHLHRGLQRDRRDDRRRDGLSARPGQLPLRRRRRVRRHLAERAAREARSQGVGEAVDRAAPQRRRPGTVQP